MTISFEINEDYSRIHQFGFIRAVSWSAQNAKSDWSHVHITLTVEIVEK